MPYNYTSQLRTIQPLLGGDMFKGEQGTEYVELCNNMMNKYHKDIKPEELLQAFQMAVSGRLESIELRTLGKTVNPKMLGIVLMAYRDHRRKAVDVSLPQSDGYRRPTATIATYDYMLQQSRVYQVPFLPVGGMIQSLYQVMISNGLLSKEYHNDLDMGEKITAIRMHVINKLDLPVPEENLGSSGNILESTTYAKPRENMCTG